MLRTIVDLTFLALALVLITTLLANRYDSVGESTVQMEIQSLKKDMLDAQMKNVLYLENRVNRVSESSDSYQISTNSRLSVLETRMQMLESKRKDNPRITNTNTAIVNGKPDQETVSKKES